MGQAAGSQSNQRTQSSSEIITNVLVSAIQNCGISYLGNQTIKIYASRGTLIIRGGVSQVQSAIINTQCLSDNKTVTDIQNKIINEITKKAEQLGKDGTAWLNAQRTNQATRIDYRVKNSITQEFIQNCASSLQSTQKVDVSAEDGGTVIIEGDVSQFITAKIISNCSQKAVMNTGLGATLRSLDNQISQQESGGISSGIATFFKSTWYIYVFIFIIIIVAALIYFRTTGGVILSQRSRY